MNKRIRSKPVALLVAVVFLQACGGGGDSTPPPQPVTPPSALSYPAPPVFTINTAITTLTPTVTGTPTGYAVSPALPAGLSMNATSGAISGTPTAVAAAANYQVTASNSGGSTSTVVSITVNDVAPDVGYARASYTFTTGSTVNVVPTSTAGTVVSWSINPALPAGLSLNASTGAITGSPTAVTGEVDHVVTAMNSGGSDTFGLSIAVDDGILLNLGNRNAFGGVALSATRLLISDRVNEDNGSWTLWDAQSATVIAQYHARYCSWVCGAHQALAGNTAVSRGSTAFVVRSSIDGSLVSTISSSTNNISWWHLSPDGNYIAEGDHTGLRVWTRTGTVILSKTGDYTFATAFLANDALRIANGSAGANVIETVALPSGAMSVTPPFNGTFSTWFSDGERFITTLGAAVYIYSKTGVQLDIASPPSFNEIGGYGNFYWTLATNLRVYEVGNSAATVTTFSNVRRGIPALSPFEEQFSGGAPVRLVDLRGSAPSVLEVTPPVDEGVLAFSTNADSWVQRTGSFVRGFPGGQPRQYGLGSVLDIAAGANHAAVATTDGKIRVFDLDTRALLATLEEPDPKLAMTADGDTLLVMRKTGNDRGLRFYSLPSGNLLDEWQFTSGVNGQVYLLDFTLARSADRVALALATDGTNQTSSEVRRFDGTVDYSSSTVNFLTLSPNGNRAAVAAGRRTLTPTTSIFTGGTITAATQGYATGWIDDDRMLVNFYRRVSTSFIDFDHAKIVDAAGTVLATLTTLPEIEELQPVSSSAIYSRVHNQIFNVDTGTVVWTGSRGGFIGDLYPNAYGAVAAGRVVHAGIDLPVVRVEMH